MPIAIDETWYRFAGVFALWTYGWGMGARLAPLQVGVGTPAAPAHENDNKWKPVPVPNKLFAGIIQGSSLVHVRVLLSSKVYRLQHGGAAALEYDHVAINEAYT